VNWLGGKNVVRTPRSKSSLGGDPGHGIFRHELRHSCRFNRLHELRRLGLALWPCGALSHFYGVDLRRLLLGRSITIELVWPVPDEASVAMILLPVTANLTGMLFFFGKMPILDLGCVPFVEICLLF
jgi:hypothetical protein